MQPLPAPPPIQVLICVNHRPPGGLPCCADSNGQELYARLHRLTTVHGLLRTVYVTRTLCLASCRPDGATVAIHPSNVWLRSCKPDDADVIFDGYVRPLVEAVRRGESESG